jgi:hypothetical protein
VEEHLKRVTHGGGGGVFWPLTNRLSARQVSNGGGAALSAQSPTQTDTIDQLIYLESLAGVRNKQKRIRQWVWMFSTKILQPFFLSPSPWWMTPSFFAIVVPCTRVAGNAAGWRKALFVPSVCMRTTSEQSEPRARTNQMANKHLNFAVAQLSCRGTNNNNESSRQNRKKRDSFIFQNISNILKTAKFKDILSIRCWHNKKSTCSSNVFDLCCFASNTCINKSPNIFKDQVIDDDWRIGLYTHAAAVAATVAAAAAVLIVSELVHALFVAVQRLLAQSCRMDD